MSGRVLGFGGRTLRSDYKTANIGKYVNSPQSEVYDKSSTLYGIYFAKSEIVRQNKCYLVVSQKQIRLENYEIFLGRLQERLDLFQ